MCVVAFMYICTNALIDNSYLHDHLYYMCDSYVTDNVTHCHSCYKIICFIPAGVGRLSYSTKQTVRVSDVCVFVSCMSCFTTYYAYTTLIHNYVCNYNYQNY